MVMQGVLDTNPRIKVLKRLDSDIRGDSVLYVMSRDQRVQDNHALLSAQEYALKKKLPLAVIFCLREKSGYRAKEHYEWMIRGLKSIEKSLYAKNISFILLIGDPYERVSGCIKHLNPDAIFFDFNPLKGPRNLSDKVASEHKLNVFVVDTHNIVPAWQASPKQEYAARTLRPKIHHQLPGYLVEPNTLKNHPYDWSGTVMQISELQEKITAVLKKLPSNGQKNLLNLYPSGEEESKKTLQDFINNRLIKYAELRNNPAENGLSGLSPYLHFGQISSLRVVLEASKALAQRPELQVSYDVLIEEMVVRKELSDNFCLYNHNYQSLEGAGDWAQKTLAKHVADEREFIYTQSQFENAETHDPAWNAAQHQLLKSGKIHGYMRMYWAKKVLEWSVSPEEAIETLVYLNDFYSIDGGDPNGYVGILWSVAGLHDRPWGERPVYGSIRSMVYNGLKRKFDINLYIEQWT